MIFVDDREPEKVFRMLEEAGVEYEIRRLEVGDFLVVHESYEVAVERKSAEDFVNSTIDGRIFRQHYLLSSRYNLSFIFIIGSIEEVLVRREIRREAVIGALISLAVKKEKGQVVPITFENEFDSILALKYIDSKIRKGELRVFPRVKAKEDYQIAMLTAIPGIGEERAKRLLEKFGNLQRIANASLYELMRVEGIGEKYARRIYDAFRGRKIR
ncbi:ERCC4 domain protein [Ferroglobus placidus DSM 10642]|uniref:ERCC4 domain protein n=1 Tax=Ferroglobus placidus (strain DSM 10642 / AEDII12DO) TaxID=589924 RepID=D3S150_FERPA|nr:ERCC4 domain-containing protein [Ferroglobus placidus]ADC64286.1 ERCC4 domain protein [Ferroglobus placidus DSM 10642]